MGPFYSAGSAPVGFLPSRNWSLRFGFGSAFFSKGSMCLYAVFYEARVFSSARLPFPLAVFFFC